LESNEGLLEDKKLMLDHAVDFYKNLFGLVENFGLKLNDNFWEEEDKATDSENELLEAPFTEEEIKLVVLTPMLREPRDQVVSLLCYIKPVGR